MQYNFLKIISLLSDSPFFFAKKDINGEVRGKEYTIFLMDGSSIVAITEEIKIDLVMGKNYSLSITHGSKYLKVYWSRENAVINARGMDIDPTSLKLIRDKIMEIDFNF